MAINKPTNQDLDIYRDRDFSISYILTDGNDIRIDTTDWEFKAQAKPTYTSDVLLIEFDISHSEELATVVMSLTDEATLNISSENPIRLGSSITSTNMVWDMVATDNAGTRQPLITGKITFHETVTREDV